MGWDQASVGDRNGQQVSKKLSKERLKPIAISKQMHALSGHLQFLAFFQLVIATRREDGKGI